MLVVLSNWPNDTQEISMTHVALVLAAHSSKGMKEISFSNFEKGKERKIHAYHALHRS